jgi:Trypsin-co-occurring domain 2
MAQTPADPESLLELLRQLREAIKTSQVDLDDRGTAFKLSEVEVEAKVTVSKAANGGLKFHVVTLGADVKREQVHTIKLKVIPTPLFVAIAGGSRGNRAAPSPLTPPANTQGSP